MSETVFDIIKSKKDFSTLVELIQFSGLYTIFEKNGPFTLFAPTNEAFEQLPEDTLKDLSDPSNLLALQEIIKYHLINKELSIDEIKFIEEIETMEGSEIMVSTDEDMVLVDDAIILGPKIQAANGVVYPISMLLMPLEEDDLEIEEEV